MSVPVTLMLKAIAGCSSSRAPLAFSCTCPTARMVSESGSQGYKIGEYATGNYVEVRLAPSDDPYFTYTLSMSREVVRQAQVKGKVRNLFKSCVWWFARPATRAPLELTIRGRHGVEKFFSHLSDPAYLPYSLTSIPLTALWVEDCLVSPKVFRIITEWVSLRMLFVSLQPSVPLYRLENFTLLRSLVISLSGDEIREELSSLGCLVSLTITDFGGQLPPLACCPTLQHVKLEDGSHLKTLDGLKDCYRLSSVDVHQCHALCDVSALATCPSLRYFSARKCGALRQFPEQEAKCNIPLLEKLCLASCGVETLPDLGRCTFLDQVDLSGCVFMRHAEQQLSSAVNLTSVDLTSSNIETVDGLSRCMQLQRVILRRCSRLRHVRGLAGAAALTTLNLNESSVADLGDLGLCSSLRSVSLRWCRELRSVEGLKNAAALTNVDLYQSSVQDLKGLASCKLLTTVNGNGCLRLTSAAGLAGAPSLTLLDLGNSRVSDLSGLNRCPKLETLLLYDCHECLSVEELAGSPALVWADFSGSGIYSLRGMDACPRLRHLQASGCENLCSAEGLAGAPVLEELDISMTPVTDLDFLTSCPALVKLNIKKCAKLSKLFDASVFPDLRVIQ